VNIQQRKMLNDFITLHVLCQTISKPRTALLIGRAENNFVPISSGAIFNQQCVFGLSVVSK